MPNSAIGSQNPNFDFEEEEEELVVDVDEEETRSSLQKHVELARYYYGNTSCAVIHGLDNLRLHFNGEGMSRSLQKKYGLIDDKGQTVSIIISVQFAPDYVFNANPPKVQYKPENIQERNGFGEQIGNMVEVFVKKRWSDLQKNNNNNNNQGVYWMQNDEKVNEYVHSVLPPATPVSQRMKLITTLIRNNHSKLARALCLYFKGNKLNEAAIMFMEAGGELPDGSFLVEANESNNFVSELITYITLRVATCYSYCCICDTKISVPFIQQGVEPNPKICTDFKCQFAYVELGICSTIPITICPSSIHYDINNNADVVDILISMMMVTATSSRRDIVFDPFPPQYIKGGVKNYDDVVAIMKKIPSVAEMQKYAQSEESLKKYLKEEVYEMVKWILTCQRPALCKLEEKRRIKAMQTEHQYMMMVDKPEKTAKFNKWRKEFGSFFAFHGSSLENWSSILRNGLINASHTKYMTTGAAYGSGIYLAPDSTTSLGYSRQGSAWNKSKFSSTNLKCLSIVEVIKHTDVQTTPNPYYVIKNEEHVTARFFLFYPHEPACRVAANSLDLSAYFQSNPSNNSK
jgi:poly [ADP-ribose] polymerase 6/8